MWKSTSLLVLAYALLQLALVKACPYLASLDGDEASSRGVNAVSSAAKQNATSKQADRRLGTSVSSNSLFGPFTSFLNSIRKVPRTQAQALKLARNDIETIISSNMGIEAKFVRLVFHDCVGDCDGCVDLTDKNNNGLDIPINALVPTVAKYKKFLTRGDVWMLAGLVAAEVSQQGTTVSFDVEFVGRPNCAANEPNGGPVRALPSAQFNTEQVLAYFKTTFGFSNRETVAILGAHTLGRAKQVNSGFEGEDGWVDHPDTLDNEFFVVLLKNGVVNTEFEQEFQDNTQITQQFPSQFMWRRSAISSDNFMLNTDMCLVVDFAGYLDPVTGSVTCTLDSSGQTPCPASPTLSIAVEYANSNSVWVNDFHDAFIKMTNAGCGGGKCTAVKKW